MVRTWKTFDRIRHGRAEKACRGRITFVTSLVPPVREDRNDGAIARCARRLRMRWISVPTAEGRSSLQMCWLPADEAELRKSLDIAPRPRKGSCRRPGTKGRQL